MSDTHYYLVNTIALLFVVPAFWALMALTIVRANLNLRIVSTLMLLLTWLYILGQTGFQLSFPPVQAHVALNLYRASGLAVLSIVIIVVSAIEIRHAKRRAVDHTIAVQEAATRLIANLQESKFIKGSDDANSDH